MMIKRQHKRRLITSVLLSLLSISLPSLARDSITNYFFRDIAHPELHEQTTAMLNAFDSEKFNEALEMADTMVANATKDLTIDKLSYARVLSNAAILKALGGDRDSAILSTGQAIEIIENTEPFHTDLINILMVRGYVYSAEDDHPDAEDALRRAQHIAHRQDGVYTGKQLPIIETLVGIKLAQGERKSADQTQRFNLKVSEQVYGVGSEDLIPTLTRIGKYFADRGGSIPLSTVQDERLYRDRLFREATALFDRSIQIIEDKYGATDIRLIEPLKGLSRTKFLQGYGRANAERPMERALAIVQGNPATDTADHARALVELADLYVMTSDMRAPELYTRAWLLLDSPAHEDLQYEFFGRPKRLLPEVPVRPILYRHPVDVEKGSELFVDIQYDIRADGRVRNATVVDGNVPNSHKKLMRDFVSTMRFRPRMMNGELQTTEDMLLHQTYDVKERAPKSAITITSGFGVPD